jgi:hypothetical protein
MEDGEIMGRNSLNVAVVEWEWWFHVGEVGLGLAREDREREREGERFIVGV